MGWMFYMLRLPQPRNAVVNDGVRVATKGQGHSQNTEDRQATSGHSALIHPHCGPGPRQGLGIGGVWGRDSHTCTGVCSSCVCAAEQLRMSYGRVSVCVWGCGQLGSVPGGAGSVLGGAGGPFWVGLGVVPCTPWVCGHGAQEQPM